MGTQGTGLFKCGQGHVTQPVMVAKGLMPNSVAFSRDISNSAEAPSFMPEALPAVTVPPLGMNAGGNPERVSMAKSVRKCSSLSMMIFCTEHGHGHKRHASGGGKWCT